ncbi:MAG: endonuclease/exonuclease/phosphatase family protein [Actinobacteria bacterium]|nr:endonuclease/exonuclease/phosphatase family protein [Actinomycetota bacterium]
MGIRSVKGRVPSRAPADRASGPATVLTAHAAGDGASLLEGTVHPLRVLTWNVWWRFGPWRARMAAIAETLRRVDADLVTLQEVWAEPAGESLAGVLARDLGLAEAFRPDHRGRRCRIRKCGALALVHQAHDVPLAPPPRGHLAGLGTGRGGGGAVWHPRGLHDPSELRFRQEPAATGTGARHMRVHGASTPGPATDPDGRPQR